MIQALALVFAVFARCEVGVLPTETLDKENSAQAVQQMLDQAFSVNGGTIAGRVIIASHTEVQGDILFSPVGSVLRFPDGTTQTTAASASADTNCYRLTSSSFSLITSSTIASVLVASTTYKFYFHLVQNTLDGQPFIRFNGDTGTNYRFSTPVLFDQGSFVHNYSNAGTGFELAGVLAANQAKQTTSIDGSLEFSTAWRLPNIVKIWNGSAHWQEQSGPLDSNTVNLTGKYAGAATLSSMQIGTDAGSISGYVEVWNCGEWTSLN